MISNPRFEPIPNLEESFRAEPEVENVMDRMQVEAFFDLCERTGYSVEHDNAKEDESSECGGHVMREKIADHKSRPAVIDRRRLFNFCDISTLFTLFTLFVSAMSGSAQPHDHADRDEEHPEEGDDYLLVEDAEEIDESELPNDEPMEADSDDEGVDEGIDEEDQADVVDTSHARFASHSPKSIFSLATHPVSPVLAVSGGEDDMGYLWRMDTGEEVARLTGHKDSVVSAAFSADGEFVATGGMDGSVRVWSRVSNAGSWEWGTWQFITNLDGPDEVVVRISPFPSLFRIITSKLHRSGSTGIREDMY
jgi:hypothetical protein